MNAAGDGDVFCISRLTVRQRITDGRLLRSRIRACERRPLFAFSRRECTVLARVHIRRLFTSNSEAVRCRMPPAPEPTRPDVREAMSRAQPKRFLLWLYSANAATEKAKLSRVGGRGGHLAEAKKQGARMKQTGMPELQKKCLDKASTPAPKEGRCVAGNQCWQKRPAHKRAGRTARNGLSLIK